jgi:hypothetical protein
MGFELFTEPAVKEEVRQMLLALKRSDYAISTLTKEQLQQYSNEFGTQVKLRKLKNGKVKVEL